MINSSTLVGLARRGVGVCGVFTAAPESSVCNGGYGRFGFLGRRVLGKAKPAKVWLACALAVAMVALATYARGDNNAVNVSLLENAEEHIVINYELADFTMGTVTIDGIEYTTISLGKESPIMVKGAPELPNICRSIVIADDAEMTVRVLDSRHHDVTDIYIAPSKGYILRTTNPADVPYTFGPTYETDAFYPGELATLREPYILRDHRGVVVELNPFQYNPVNRTLRVYTDVTLEVVRAGRGRINVLDRRGVKRGLSLAFDKIYARHFLNYPALKRYTPLDETGDMLIIYHDSWSANVQPLVDHKNSIGIDTTAVGVTTIGNNSTSIKNYIQNSYNSGDLAFVLLIGDADEVATPSAVGGSADPTYALVAGGDSYPDILVGRFSAQTADQVDTQVLRTIEYEEMPATEQAWFKRGTGIASNQGPGHNGEYDNEHMGYICDDLLDYGYTEVDQIYDPTATASQVTNAVNDGRGIINYCGHGSQTSWGTTGFSNSDINSLTNDNMLPFIFDVACINGQFDGSTCFAEAWLRATNGSEPTGAIGIYASSINQYWDPPMTAQDEIIDQFAAEAYSSFGALCFAGSCKMMDDYGSQGEDMFNTWHVFGDPSLRVIGAVEAQPTPTPTTTPTPVPTPTPQPQAETELNGSYLTHGSQFIAIFRLNQSIERPLTAYAVIILPNGRKLNALTLSPALKPVATGLPRLNAPFSSLLLQTVIPPGAPLGDYEVVVAFFDPLKPIRCREDAFLEASASFTVR